MHKYINHVISNVCYEESIYLLRLSRRMRKHDCRLEHIQRCIQEAILLKKVSEHPEYVIPFDDFKYAFRL